MKSACQIWFGICAWERRWADFDFFFGSRSLAGSLSWRLIPATQIWCWVRFHAMVSGLLRGRVEPGTWPSIARQAIPMS